MTSDNRLRGAFEDDLTPALPANGMPTAGDIFGRGGPVPPRRDNKAVQELQARVEQLDSLLDASLVPQEDGSFHYKRFVLTGTGLICPEDMTREEYEEIGRVVLNIGSSLAWLLGDWVAWGEHFQWGETYRLLAAEFDYEIETLYAYASVCKKVLIRNQGLSFAHHRLVMAMPEALQQHWLQRAEKRGWKVAELRAAIKSERSSVQSLPSNAQANPLTLLNFREKRSAIRKDFNTTLDTLAKAASNKHLRDEARIRLSQWRQLLDEWERALDE